MSEIRSIAREMKNIFNGLISRLDIDLKRICELKDRSVENFQTNLKRKNNEKREHQRIVR